MTGPLRRIVVLRGRFLLLLSTPVKVRPSLLSLLPRLAVLSLGVLAIPFLDCRSQDTVADDSKDTVKPVSIHDTIPVTGRGPSCIDALAS